MKTVMAVVLVATAAAGQSVYVGTGTSRGAATMNEAAGEISQVYVAPVSAGGNDSNPCTIVQPCLTPQHASSVVRGMPGGKHVVTFRGGTYFLGTPWTLGSADSGNSETAMVYQNYAGETPVISGGRLIAGTWTVDPYVDCGTNCTAYFMDLDGNAANSGHYENFEALFYNGVRRARPQQRGGAGSYLTNACGGTNAAPMCVAGASQAAADTACGCPAGAGPCAYQSTPCSGSTPWMCFNKFQYSATNIDGAWRNIGLGDVELLAFEKWSMGRARLASAAAGVASLTGPLVLSDGNSGCLPGYSYLVENVKEAAQQGQWYLDRGVHVMMTWSASPSSGVTSYRIYRGTTSGWPYTNIGAVSATTLAFNDFTVSLNTTYYYVVTAVSDTGESNYSEEVQAVIPATFLTPSDTWRLYIYADTSVGEDPNTAEVIVPGLTPSTPSLIVANGLQYVTFQGLTFQHDNWMPGLYGLGDSQGIPLVPAALSLTDSSNITFDGVTVNHIQGWGIEFVGGEREPTGPEQRFL